MKFKDYLKEAIQKFKKGYEHEWKSEDEMMLMKDYKKIISGYK